MKNVQKFFDNNKIYSPLLFIKYLIITFIIISVFGICLNIMFYILMKNKKINELVEKEQRELLIKKERLLSKFQDVNADLLVIMGMPFFENYLNATSKIDNEKYKKLTEDSFKKYLKIKKNYDQIRYINHNGIEQIRITRNQLKKPDKKINFQDKSARNYFKDGLKLSYGCLGISDFNLNMEYGDIEIPYKPVLRFFTRVFTSNTNKQGVLVINRLGADILDLISQKKLNKLEDIYFIHQTGHFISSPIDDDNWGNSIANRKNKKFQNLFPSVWNQINKEKTGVIYTKDKLFIFDSISFSEMFKELKFFSREKYWMMICVIPTKRIIWQEINSNLLFTIFLIEVIIDILLSFLLTILFVGRKRSKYELQRDAYTDPLTGLLNRRIFFKLFYREAEKAIKNNTSLSIAMGDIDFFKKVNDTYGHEAGDIVLEELTNIIKKTTRENDIICRWGGEEILILFPQCNVEIATKVTERIRQNIEEHSFKCKRKHKHKKIKVTMSFGVSIYDKEKNDVDDSISEVDKMLYKSKQNGRNKVTTNIKNISKDEKC